MLGNSVSNMSFSSIRVTGPWRKDGRPYYNDGRHRHETAFSEDTIESKLPNTSYIRREEMSEFIQKAEKAPDDYEMKLKAVDAPESDASKDIECFHSYPQYLQYEITKNGQPASLSDLGVEEGRISYKKGEQKKNADIILSHYEQVPA